MVIQIRTATTSEETAYTRPFVLLCTDRAPIRGLLRTWSHVPEGLKNLHSVIYDLWDSVRAVLRELLPVVCTC